MIVCFFPLHQEEKVNTCAYRSDASSLNCVHDEPCDECVRSFPRTLDFGTVQLEKYRYCQPYSAAVDGVVRLTTQIMDSDIRTSAAKLPASRNYREHSMCSMNGTEKC